MDDADLERMAVKELLREAEAHTTSCTVVKERKLNPSKANKNFLGRTLNNVITHNKREEYRTQRNCRDKLRALEERRLERLKREYSEKNVNEKDVNRSSKRSDSALEIFSSSDNEMENKKQIVRYSSSRKNVRRRRSHSKSSVKLLEEVESSQYAQNEYYSQYFDQLAAYALASKSYYQVGKWLCYQALLAGTTENYEQHNLHDLFNKNILENDQEPVNNEPICLSSDDEDAISNSELRLVDDNDNDSLISLESWANSDIESAALPEHAVECQLIDEELSELQICPPEGDTIELSDSDANANDDDNNNDNDDNDDDNSILETNKNVSIDLTSD